MICWLKKEKNYSKKKKLIRFFFLFTKEYMKDATPITAWNRVQRILPILTRYYPRNSNSWRFTKNLILQPVTCPLYSSQLWESNSLDLKFKVKSNSKGSVKVTKRSSFNLSYLPSKTPWKRDLKMEACVCCALCETPTKRSLH